MIKENKNIKNFKLPLSNGKSFELFKNLKKNLVIFVYPKDNTPGCTSESIDFSNKNCQSLLAAGHALFQSALARPSCVQKYPFEAQAFFGDKEIHTPKSSQPWPTILSLQRQFSYFYWRSIFFRHIK